MEATLLIVDDEKNTRDGLRLALEDDFDVFVASNAAEAMEVLTSESVDLMVTDLRLGGDDGMKVIDSALALPKPPICIMMTAYGSVDTAVEAMKRGAYHFVTKPLNIDELEILIKRALRSQRMESENKSLRQQVSKKFDVPSILGNSRALERVLETVRQVAATRATVLVEGDNGTGKELVAHALHNLSGRPKSKLVIVHCAALSPQILESELFGHEKGAFTDARERRLGRFEQADGGTLFLDEIGEIDASTQVKLLRALGERTIERVGGSTPIKVDVRVIAATNRDLTGMVEKGEFREDLYYRLNVIRIRMPSLAERREDIPVLAESFLREFAAENGREVREMTADAMTALVDYTWPGNVRELRSALEYAVIMSRGDKITLRNLPETVRSGRPGTDRAGSKIDLERPDDFNLHAMEKRLIQRALAHTDENRTEAAELLGISRRTLQRKLREYAGENPE